MLTREKYDKQRAVAERLMKWVDGLLPTVYNAELVRIAQRYITIFATGYWSAPAVERFYRKIADAYHVNMSQTYEPNTCLIVTNDIGPTGGHARVIERWIAADKARKYSIAFTSNYLMPPEKTCKIVEHSGGKLYWVKGNDIEKGLELRQIASSFECVLLVPLPKDVEHVIAFGTKDFNRPVGFYNTADHIAWIGISVADKIADMRSWGQAISFKHRGYSDSMIVPIPVENSAVALPSKLESRRILGLEADAKYLVTTARELKFTSVNGKTFPSRVDRLLEIVPDLVIIALGIRPGVFKDWAEFENKWQSRFRALGPVPHSEFLLYQRAADLVMDSYPGESLTVMADAVFCGTPILSHSNSADWIVGSNASVADNDKFTELAVKLLNSPEFAAHFSSETAKVLSSYAGARAFANRQSAFMQELVNTRKHLPRDYSSTPMEFGQEECARSVAETGRFCERFTSRLIAYRPTFLFGFLALLVKKIALRILKQECF